MAEGAQVEDTDTDSSVSITAADDVHEYHCYLCEREKGIHKKGCSQCTDCQYYMCENCRKNHEGSTKSRDHKILELKCMSFKPPLDIDTKPEKCKKHDGEYINYICHDHDFLGCPVCIQRQHSDCFNVNFIPAISKGIIQSNEYDKFNTVLQQMLQKPANDICSIDALLKSSNDYHIDQLAQVKQHRQNIDKELNKQQEDLHEDIQRSTENMQKKLNTSKDTIESIHQEVITLHNKIYILQKSKRETKLYIAMRRAEHKLKDLDDRITRTKTGIMITKPTFCSNKKLLDMLIQHDAIGTIVKERSQPLHTLQLNRTPVTRQHDAIGTIEKERPQPLNTPQPYRVQEREIIVSHKSCFSD